MTRAQFIASICTIPFIGKLFKKPSGPFDIRYHSHFLSDEEVAKLYFTKEREVFIADTWPKHVSLITYNRDGTYSRSVYDHNKDLFTEIEVFHQEKLSP